MEKLRLSPYISESKIQIRINEIAETLNKKLKGKDVVAICVLKGAFVFYSQLIRKLDFDIRCDFLAVTSYSGARSTGEVRLTMDLSQPIENKDVLLVEDIVDTGLTMNYLKALLRERRPHSLTCISLLEKPDALKVPCEVDIVGFKIPNDFVVGFGLDYQNLYRNLPYIAQIQDLQ
jgi:hypoxanthine phosphoribosyltransferase